MNWVGARFCMSLALSACLVGCSSEEREPHAAVPKTAVLLKVPLEITVKQRTTTFVPGSDNRLSLTIDDVTRNQVMVSLATDGGDVNLPTRSMSPDDMALFKFGENEYSLTLNELDNALVGDDVAKFSIAGPSEGGLSEQGKIEQLIEAVAKLDGATFIRNDTEHSAAEAAEHLRTKWEAARDQITTARQFIDEIASKSSLTGEPYQIRFADGKTVTASEFFNQRLAARSRMKMTVD
jgi:hypothetical protein